MDLELHILPTVNRISALQLSEKLNKDIAEKRHLLVDVRSESEFNMCRIEGSINYPIESLRDEKFEDLVKEITQSSSEAVFICRRGNDSQIAAKKILEAIEDDQRGKVLDLIGGLHAWAANVDSDFPVY